MEFDLVHDIQIAYRKVLNCMSRPGLIENIKNESDKLDIEICFNNQSLVLMLMLLDAQASFKIVSKKEHEIAAAVNQLTYAKNQSTEEADYIFIFKDADEKMLEEAVRAAKIGSLIDPHKSATVIIEAEQIFKAEEYRLKGPGIESTAYISIKTESDWVKERENKITEYPLGIDLIFVDKVANIVCLPRTTKVQKCGEEI